MPARPPVGRASRRGRGRDRGAARSAALRGLAGPVRRAAQPAARDGRDPEPPGPDRPPAARPARRAGADLRPAARGRGARGAGPAAGPARRRRPRARSARSTRGRSARRSARRSSRACPIAPPIRAVAGTRRVVALVGPTGVGKTTTVAKLAANFKLAARPARRAWSPSTPTGSRRSSSSGPMPRSSTCRWPWPTIPARCARAIDELGDVDLVFIDTAGRSPRDEVKIRELADFLAAGPARRGPPGPQRRWPASGACGRPSSGSPWSRPTA